MSRETEDLNRRLLRARDAMDRAFAEPLDVPTVAAVGAGWFARVDEAVAAWVTTTVAASPGPDVDAYRHRHDRYRELYPALAPTFHAS